MRVTCAEAQRRTCGSGAHGRSGDRAYYMAMRKQREQHAVDDSTEPARTAGQTAGQTPGQTDEFNDPSADSPVSWSARARSAVHSYLTTHSPGFYAGVVCCLLAALVLVLPSPYVVEAPGPTQDVLGTSNGKPVIAISGDHSGAHHDDGRLLLLTVNASGTPQYPVTNAEALISWLSPHRTVTPSEAVFPVGQTSQQYATQSARQMTGSQKSAAQAALNFAQTLGIDTRGVTISIHVDDIGGPSAGMMYALGAIDKLTPQEETGGRTIAGTGTIDKQGAVGAIGGIRLKMLGARRDAATWFLAPQANCAEVVGHVPQGLRDVSVSTLSEAYSAVLAIGKGEGQSLPHCTAPVNKR